MSLQRHETARLGNRPSTVASVCFVAWPTPPMLMAAWAPWYQMAFDRAREQVAHERHRAHLFGHEKPGLN